MPNEIISADVREADAKWVLRKAPSDGSLARLRKATHPEIKNNLPLWEKEAERAARLAELSRRAAKQDAAIAKMKSIVTAIKDADPDSRATLVERLIAAAREVVR